MMSAYTAFCTVSARSAITFARVLIPPVGFPFSDCDDSAMPDDDGASLSLLPPLLAILGASVPLRAVGKKQLSTLHFVYETREASVTVGGLLRPQAPRSWLASVIYAPLRPCALRRAPAARTPALAGSPPQPNVVPSADANCTPNSAQLPPAPPAHAQQNCSLPSVSRNPPPSEFQENVSAAKPCSGMCTHEAPSSVQRYTRGPPVQIPRRVDSGSHARDLTGSMWTSTAFCCAFVVVSAEGAMSSVRGDGKTTRQQGDTRRR